MDNAKHTPRGGDKKVGEGHEVIGEGRLSRVDLTLWYWGLSHATMMTQRYEQFWYKPIPHDFENSYSTSRHWMIEGDKNDVSVRENAYGNFVPCGMGYTSTRLLKARS